MRAGKLRTLRPYLLHYHLNLLYKVLIALYQLRLLYHQLLPPQLSDTPHSLYWVQCTAVPWKEPLLDSIIEVVFNLLSIVNAQVVHVDIGLTLNLAN